jgi:hypothetical protein
MEPEQEHAGGGEQEHEESFYSLPVETAHDVQRTAENAWTVHEATELPAWQNAVQNADPEAGAISRLFPDHEEMEAAAERLKELKAPSDPVPTPGPPAAAADPVAAPAPSTPAPAASAPAPAAPELPTPSTPEMAEMVENIKANGGIPDAPPVSAPAAAPELPTPSTPEMSEMVENIQRAQQEASSATEASTATSAAAETADTAGATSAAADTAGAADAAEAGISGMEVAGRAMGGLGVLGGGLELYQGINEIAEGNGHTGQGVLDVAAGGLGVAAGGAALMGAACPPLAIAAAAAGMGALGNEKSKEWGWWGQHEENGKMVNRDSLDFVADTTHDAGVAAHKEFGDGIGGDIAAGVAETGAAIGSGALAVGGDIVAGVAGAAQGIAHGAEALWNWL